MIDDVLYYVEQKNKKLLLIKESAANTLDYHLLKSKCKDVWQAATRDEIQLIQRTLSPIPPASENKRRNESNSHNTSYSSITSSGEVDYASEERWKKELYRNYLIFDMFEDSKKKHDSNGGKSKQGSDYSTDQDNHSSHSSGYQDSSNHSSSYDDSSCSNDSLSCGGSSSGD